MPKDGSTTIEMKMRERRFTPTRSFKQQSPSRLADLDGRRRPGQEMQFGTANKAPKRRFNLGDMFEYDGSVWAIIFMYRLDREPGVWYHCIEEQTGMRSTEIGEYIQAIGAGATSPRIVISPFKHDGDVRSYFSDIYMNGSRSHKSTQQLLQLKKV